MNKEPYLVILAAGMGSRYGGLKQMDSVDDNGHVIIDYSIYDAIEAGFKNIVFIIKKSIEDEFKKRIGNRIEEIANVYYVYQEVNTLPDGYSVPANREKPWGTAHSIMQIKDVVDAPFAVINADDYYGKSSYSLLYKYLTEDIKPNEGCMIGYVLKNTISMHGHVARGVCKVENGELRHIDEIKKIEVHGDKIEFESGETWKELPGDSVVSMNMWGFNAELVDGVSKRFAAFLDEELDINPLKCEFLLPEVVQSLLRNGELKVNVLTSTEKWFGVTYKEDKEGVVAAFKELRDKGLYDNL